MRRRSWHRVRPPHARPAALRQHQGLRARARIARKHDLRRVLGLLDVCVRYACAPSGRGGVVMQPFRLGTDAQRNGAREPFVKKRSR